MSTITITLDDADMRRAFSTLRQRFSNTTHIMDEIGEILLGSTQERFKTGIGPDGIAWVSLKRESRKPLVKGGTLRDQISTRAGDGWVEIHAAANYARFHQEGTQGPYDIRPKDKKAVKVPGVGARKKVTHPGIPARPFMGISDDDRKQIAAFLQRLVQEI